MSNGTPTSATTTTGNGNGDPLSVAYWLVYFAKQGPLTLVLAVIAAALFWFAVIPMRKDQERYIDATIVNNSLLANSFAELAKSSSELQRTHANGFSDLKQMHVEANKRLDAISATGQEQTMILRQIRDDTRNGTWNKNGHE
jgi:hypothetical protein